MYRGIPTQYSVTVQQFDRKRDDEPGIVLQKKKKQMENEIKYLFIPTATIWFSSDLTELVNCNKKYCLPHVHHNILLSCYINIDS